MAETMGEAMLAILEERFATITRVVESVAEENLFRKPAPDGNSVGNLVLHVAGNARTLIGRIGGRVPYDRDRDYEFTAKGLSRREVLARLEDAMRVCRQVLPRVGEASFAEEAERPLFEGESRGKHVLRSIEHFGYHTGQIVSIAKWWRDEKKNGPGR